MRQDNINDALCGLREAVIRQCTYIYTMSTFPPVTLSGCKVEATLLLVTVGDFIACISNYEQ